MVGVQNSCRCITCSSSGSHGWVTATAQPPGEMVRLQSASREKSEIQSAVPLNAYCFCTIEKLKNCKLSHRINWGPSAYILRKIQRQVSDYPDVNTVTIFLYFPLISVFCARVFPAPVAELGLNWAHWFLFIHCTCLYTITSPQSCGSPFIRMRHIHACAYTHVHIWIFFNKLQWEDLFFMINYIESWTNTKTIISSLFLPHPR